MRTANQRIEITGDGFVIHKRRWLWFWDKQPVKWSSVAAIRAVMWDCFSCHAFGYRLVLSDGVSVCLTDLDDHWAEFRRRLHEEYPGIDSAVVRKVEETFPDEIELTCWKNPQEGSLR